jgi:N-acylglucosamine-6-phosphate 2-epimerase
MSVFDQLRGGLVVSCQPVTGGPMDRPEIVAAMAQAAVEGGAAGVRIEGLSNLKATRPVLSVPIIALIKHYDPSTPVRITPRVSDTVSLMDAGADVIAYDATDRPRSDTREAVLQTILSAGRVAMADCATFGDARIATAAGAQIIGSTLSGYTQSTQSASCEPDIALIERLRDLPSFVMAEGRFNTPDLVASAIAAGADAVTVGTALTRLEHMTGWFRDAVVGARQR